MGCNLETIFDIGMEEEKNALTLEELNYKMNSLVRAKEDLEKARNKFYRSNRENYIDYENLTIAIYCIEKEIDSFKTKTWR